MDLDYSPELVERYSKPVPRYTSYPTAPHFHDGVDNATYWRWLEELAPGTRLSLYFHVPYCDRLCWFCGCHTKQVLRYEPIAKYLVALHAEISAVAARLEGRGKVVALHFGGGSPSMLVPDDWRRLNALLRESFPFADDAEFSIEMDPNDMEPARYDALAEIGVTRASLGVQDFNHEVQVAINRLQTYEQTKAVVDAMRERGVRSVNLDVLYGLPHQTLDTVAATIEQTLSLDPDRMALFGYAHVPWMKTHQRMIDEAALPDIHARFAQARAASAQIVAAGYDAIGFDHFAKPDDKMAIVTRSGALHRNFQGYTVDEPDALIGFGASAIGQLPQGYVQNTVPTAEYQRRVLADGATIAKGVAFTAEDRVRAYVIERLMCDFSVSLLRLRELFGANANPVLGEMQLTVMNDSDGFTEIVGNSFRVRPRGRPFVRTIAAGFDSYLRVGGARYSLAV
ncbi:oxygen-independent coproporphyrinogen III oxidase [Devosia sp.]|uniref:oxygen-independent coproporphyrinogen III oxidase n=1 Tax=Devosia sp. TaxID=1871048 RepID=UPI002EF5B104